MYIKYGTPLFKHDICTSVLPSTVAQEICKGTCEFVTSARSINPCDELYACEVHSCSYQDYVNVTVRAKTSLVHTSDFAKLMHGP